MTALEVIAAIRSQLDDLEASIRAQEVPPDEIDTRIVALTGQLVAVITEGD